MRVLTRSLWRPKRWPTSRAERANSRLSRALSSTGDACHLGASRHRRRERARAVRREGVQRGLDNLFRIGTRPAAIIVGDQKRTSDGRGNGPVHCAPHKACRTSTHRREARNAHPRHLENGTLPRKRRHRSRQRLGSSRNRLRRSRPALLAQTLPVGARMVVGRVNLCSRLTLADSSVPKLSPTKWLANSVLLKASFRGVLGLECSWSWRGGTQEQSASGLAGGRVRPVQTTPCRAVPAGLSGQPMDRSTTILHGTHQTMHRIALDHSAYRSSRIDLCCRVSTLLTA